MRGDDRPAMAVAAGVRQLQAEEQVGVVAVGVAVGLDGTPPPFARTRTSWIR